MKLVYLAHPYISDPQNNVELVNKIAKKIISAQIVPSGNMEYIPFVPHNVLSVFSESDNPQVRGITEELSRRMVTFCAELWICAPTISEGMAIEIEVAKEIQIPIIPYKDLKEKFRLELS